MRVMLLGATGLIGSAILPRLRAAGHDVVALSRRVASDNFIIQTGGTPLRGDLRDPSGWIAALDQVDALIHTAASFSPHMAKEDHHLMHAIIAQAINRKAPLRLIYTGGAWLYGRTGSRRAVETDPFAPIAAFAFMVDHAQMALECPALSSLILHPALVYDGQGGAFARFVAALAQGERPQIWGDAAARWPLVHRLDLARVYVDLLERSDISGHINIAAQEGVAVGSIVDQLAKGMGRARGYNILPRAEVLSRFGPLAEGPMLDQQMSAAKLRRFMDWSPVFQDIAAFGKTLAA